MEPWNGWPVERIAILFLGVAYLVVWVQLSLYHWKGAFHNRIMWGPVIFTPLAVVAAVTYALNRASWSSTLLIWIFAIAAIEGAVGVFFHLKGVASQVGGVNLRNVTVGPPFLLPLTYAALGAFGLIVHFVGRNGGAA